MTLRSVHIIFIAASILLFGFFALWSFEYAKYMEKSGYYIVAALSSMTTISLVVYAVLFFKKTGEKSL